MNAPTTGWLALSRTVPLSLALWANATAHNAKPRIRVANFFIRWFCDGWLLDLLVKKVVDSKSAAKLYTKQINCARYRRIVAVLKSQPADIKAVEFRGIPLQ
jgi:hypothetical protein